MSNYQSSLPRRPFNTPLESGFRSLFILAAISPTFRDLQRLVYYDYIMVHSNDIIEGPPSLHPAIPHRSGEWLVRRNLILGGLDLMYSRELVKKEFTSTGIMFGATELTIPFLKYFNSNYARALQETASWLANRFELFSDDELKNFMTSNLGRWGAEFKRESVVRGLSL